MLEHWISLDDLPDEGKDFAFPEQNFWTERFAAFNMQAEIITEIETTATVMRQDDNALIRGSIKGVIILPCDRCAESFELPIDVSFDEFEAGEAEIDGEETRIVSDKGVLSLNIGAVFWEQMVLTIPMRPTCAESCNGVCSVCGINLNEGECSCNQEVGDPRLAVFKGLKVE